MKTRDTHLEALLGIFFLLISPVVWLVLGGDTFGVNQNPTTAWVLFTTFAITAYLAFIAFVSFDQHNTKPTIKKAAPKKKTTKRTTTSRKKKTTAKKKVSKKTTKK